MENQVELNFSNQENYKATTVQFLAAFCSLLGAFSMGTVLGYTSPAIPQMTEIKNLNNYTTIEELQPFLSKKDEELISWITSIINIGGIFGGILGATLINLAGHRLILSSTGLLCTVGYLLIGFSKNPYFVLIGRFINGLCCGFFCASIPVYIVEISTAKTRGFLGCCFQGFITLGTLYISLVSVFVDWRSLAFLCTIPVIALSVLIWFMPESPSWLIKKNRYEEAQRSIKRLRIINSNSALQLKNINISNDQFYSKKENYDEINLNKELNFDLKTCNNKNLNDSLINVGLKSIKKENVDNCELEDKDLSLIKDLKHPYVYKPLIYGLILMVFQQLSGANAIFSSMQTILNTAKFSKINEQTAAFIVNIFFLAFAWLSTYVVNLFGRRTLLLFSAVGYVIAYSILSFFFVYNENFKNELPTQLNFLPFLSLIIFVTVHALGYGSVSWFLVPELNVNQHREKISAYCTATNWIASFLIMKNFTVLIPSIGYGGIFIAFNILSILSGLIVYKFIPETKDKTPEQIKQKLCS